MNGEQSNQNVIESLHHRVKELEDENARLRDTLVEATTYIGGHDAGYARQLVKEMDQ